MAESPDLGMRRYVAGLPVPLFDSQPFVEAPPLADATVAIVTSAGLIRPGEVAWEMQAPSFRVFERGERDLILGHLSPNFDRSGMAADLNVAYPIERLPEMQREGAIGALASRHMSFMGAIVWSRSQRSSSTPAAAQHGFCARTVSTLSC